MYKNSDFVTSYADIVKLINQLEQCKKLGSEFLGKVIIYLGEYKQVLAEEGNDYGGF